jgi:hypothetical protein
MKRGAWISECERYRYRLTREWGEGSRILWVMLNPSTADAREDDPTVRRCISFSRAMGGGSLCVVNLYALRATDPAKLLEASQAGRVGPDNDYHIRVALQGCDSVICAWGTHDAASFGDRDERVLDLVREERREPLVLGLTRKLKPSHPLYMPKTVRPFLWSPAAISRTAGGRKGE